MTAWRRPLSCAKGAAARAAETDTILGETRRRQSRWEGHDAREARYHQSRCEGHCGLKYDNQVGLSHMLANGGARDGRQAAFRVVH